MYVNTLAKLTPRRQTMKIRIVVLFAMVFGMVIVFIGCDDPPAELITCPKGPNGPVTAKVGRTEYGALYELGTVVLEYSEATKKRTNLTDDVPLAAVNDFLIDKEYTPEVIGSYFGAEVIYIGDNVDPYPMLKKLERISGVRKAHPNMFISTSVLFDISIFEEVTDGPSEKPKPTTTRAIVEVGKLEDGSLYELGVVLVQYDETPFNGIDRERKYAALWERMNDFFVNKGYTPKDMGPIYGVAVIHVGECVDTAHMLEELKTIPGVIDARLEILYTTFEIATGLRVADLPNVSP